MESTVEQPTSCGLEFVETGYGKNHVKLMSVEKSTTRHTVKEITVCVELSLNCEDEYTKADNSGVIATDTQKNTILILARQHGIAIIEEFSLVLCRHFLVKYDHVRSVRVCVEEAPWKRIHKGTGAHVHAFVWSPEVIHFCEVLQVREKLPVVSSGLRELRILKTAKTSFRHFLRDEYTTLAEADDRLLCTVLHSRWWYARPHSLDYNSTWETVKSLIVDTFVGPTSQGVPSSSVQSTLYQAQLSVFDHLPQVDVIEMTMPNVHYVEEDFARFKSIDLENSKNKVHVYVPLDNPRGNIRATLRRKPVSKL